jgi:hypothetical protein
MLLLLYIRWCWARCTRSTDIRKARVRTSSPSSITRVRFPFLPCRANIVIRDTFVQGAQDIADATDKLQPGDGTTWRKRCDVASRDYQAALFEFAMTKFEGVEIVASVPSPWVCVVAWY